MNYAYDYLSRVTQITENGATSGAGVLAAYVYDSLGHRIQVARAGSTASSTNTSFDSIGRLHGLTHALAGTSADLTAAFA